MIEKKWDIYEVALLIYTYLFYKELPINEKKDKLLHLSNILRNYAINNGLSIDKRYRNIVGIEMKLLNIEYLFTNGEKGLSSYSKLDLEMYNIYTSDIEKFKSILDDTKRKIGIKLINDLNFKDNNHLSTDNVNLEPYKHILNEKFLRGFKLDSSIEISKLKKYYENMYGVNSEYDDDMLQKIMKKSGIVYKNRVYLPNMLLSEEIKNKIIDFINKCFEQGKQVIYYEALFKYFSEDFYEQKIYDADMLKSYLYYVCNKKWYFEKEYISIQKQIKVDLYNEVRKCIMTFQRPVKVDEISEILFNIPEFKIKQVIRQNKKFIYDSTGKYIHADMIDISDEELMKISQMIHQLIYEKEFIAGNELIVAISKKFPELYERISIFSNLSIREALACKLYNKFEFKGNIISEKGHYLTMSDVFKNYCKSKEHITLEEFNLLKQEFNTNIYFNVVYDNCLRISKTDFVSKDKARFDIKATDEAIERYCIGEYISISEITYFSSFPESEFPWNSYLLEHYVAEYSEKFTLFHSNFNAETCVGAIVKKESRFNNFNEVLSDVLVKANKINDTSSALNYLCERGFIARRKYSDIYKVLDNAKNKKIMEG